MRYNISSFNINISFVFFLRNGNNLLHSDPQWRKREERIVVIADRWCHGPGFISNSISRHRVFVCLSQVDDGERANLKHECTVTRIGRGTPMKKRRGGARRRDDAATASRKKEATDRHRYIGAHGGAVHLGRLTSIYVSRNLASRPRVPLRPRRAITLSAFRRYAWPFDHLLFRFTQLAATCKHLILAQQVRGIN